MSRSCHCESRDPSPALCLFGVLSMCDCCLISSPCLCLQPAYSWQPQGVRLLRLLTVLLLYRAHCSYGNVKQQAYKVETESRSFDDFCKRNSVSRAVSCCFVCCGSKGGVATHTST
jgi:hypothetical protein